MQESVRGKPRSWNTSLVIFAACWVAACLNAVLAEPAVEIKRRGGKSEIHVAVSRGRGPEAKPRVRVVGYKEDACASGYFQEDVEKYGWGFLHVQTHSSCADLDQAFGAGYVEGALTSKQIWVHRQNTIDQFTFPKAVEDFLKTNDKYTEEMSRLEYDNPDDAAYWWQMRLVREQIAGLDAGYHAVTRNAQRVPAMTFVIMNTDGDLYDIIPAVVPSKNVSLSHPRRRHRLRQSRDRLSADEPSTHMGAGSGRLPRRAGPLTEGQVSPLRMATEDSEDGGASAQDGGVVEGEEGRGSWSMEELAEWGAGGRCSGVVKLLADKSDLYISQVAFTGLEEMLRMYKMYSLAYSTVRDGDERLPGAQGHFSSYPGHIYSGDDFYILSSNIALVETTLSIFNDSLYHYVQPVGTVLEWGRNLVANRLARSAKEWVDIFSRYNSGTYNNEWLVVDYNLFTPGEELKPGTLWVLDQMPGFIDSWDATEDLKKKGYYASYNSPASDWIFKLSGWPDAVAKWGAWYSHDKCARALIYARDHSKVVDLDSFKHLIRYNDYKHDPLSYCEGCNPPYDAEFAPASRGDLNDPNNTYPYPWIGQRDHSSIDAKITSYGLAKSFASLVVAGPTCDQQPVFQWSKSAFFNMSHLGQPDRFDFPWLYVNWGENGHRGWATLVENSTLCDPNYKPDEE